MEQGSGGEPERIMAKSHDMSEEQSHEFMALTLRDYFHPLVSSFETLCVSNSCVFASKHIINQPFS